jgi:EAL domain-containing protein (putative c-di-GMP-specific phosphodiesterase class I)
VQSVKIDRTFVGAMLHEELVARVVRTITDLAHGLGMTVVAEGVETEEQAARLAAIGCDEMQGFLVSRPLPYEDFAAFVRRLGAGS